jgi:hypothetical protein
MKAPKTPSAGTPAAVPPAPLAFEPVRLRFTVEERAARTGDVFENAIADFARAYADQNERDFEALEAAVRSGRLRAETGV